VGVDGFQAGIIERIGRLGRNLIQPGINAVWTSEVLLKIGLLDANPFVRLPMYGGDVDHAAG
jgi:hypothetical protein